jgi:ubiquinone/menaquinone biosynthesis C-methylase UbiE
MAEEQLAVAREYQSYHAEKFGYNNTEFLHGNLEVLEELPGLEHGSFDIIISDCVINLCANKLDVLKASCKLLKPGGELYCSDFYASCRIPLSLKHEQLFLSECLSGALYWNDFISIAKEAGFLDPRLVEELPINIINPMLAEMIREEGNGSLIFYKATFRLFNIDDLEPDCENYGQTAVYN